jgi:DNA-binding protein HU-beta
MNNLFLIDAMAAETELKKTDAKKAIEAFITVVGNALKSGERIGLVGFGSFDVIERSARTGRNPRTGKEIQIPAKKTVRFKPGSELNESVR